MQQEIQAEFERLHGDVEYLNAHYETLLDDHPEEWVAVYNQEVVGTHAEHRQLLKDLKAKGISLSKVVIQRVTRDPEDWLFAAA